MPTERSLRDHRDWNDMEGAMTHDRLARNPEQQAEAIAHHYARMAALSMDLLELVRARKELDTNRLASADEASKMFLRVFREAHLKDLGIPLEWKVDDADYLRDHRFEA